MSNLKIHEGIFIDIFPVDNAPDNIKLANKQRKKVLLLDYINSARFNIDRSFKGLRGIKNLFVYMSFRILNIIPNKYNVNAILKASTKYNDKSTKNVGVVVFPVTKESSSETVFNRDSFRKSADLKFEECYFPVSQNYDFLLKKSYGDYLKIPPANEQNGNHGVIKISFDLKTYYNGYI